MNLRTLFPAFCVVAMIIFFTTYIGNCTREKPVTEHSQNLGKILNIDSLKSDFDTRYQAEKIYLVNAYKDTIQQARQNYRTITRIDKQIEYRYREAPLVTTCDSVIGSKNIRIDHLEGIVYTYSELDLQKDSLIESLNETTNHKNKTIADLNEGYQDAIYQLEKAVQPKRIGLGLQMGYGVGSTIKPGAYLGIGLSYNFVRF